MFGKVQICDCKTENGIIIFSPFLLMSRTALKITLKNRKFYLVIIKQKNNGIVYYQWMSVLDIMSVIDMQN